MDEEKPLGVLAWIVIAFLLLVVLGVIAGTVFPELLAVAAD